jgi:hypothetical protein
MWSGSMASEIQVNHIKIILSPFAVNVRIHVSALTAMLISYMVQ